MISIIVLSQEYVSNRVISLLESGKQCLLFGRGFEINFNKLD